MPETGKVYLVGAGPGDPGLITLRGAEVLGRADTVIMDRLAHPRLLHHAPSDVELIYAGKSSRRHTIGQEDITALIVDRARAGRVVVRLKGGDPFVFGRGGEEAEALAAEGIDFEIVPGVSSAIAAPAFAGIPVTSRFTAASFAVVTGHEAPGKSRGDVRWDRLATAVDTIVCLMGVENLPWIVSELLDNGRDAGTPVAVIEWGTHPRQRTVTGTLADIVDICRNAHIGAPAVTVVGEVVRLRQTISWFETRPLFGRRTIVTRAADQAGELSSLLL